MTWAGLAQRQFPELELLYAVPNAAKRSPRLAAYMKAEGLKAGVPDLHLPVARLGYIGLWIEMKAGKNKPTDKQGRWAELLRAQGHRVMTCYSSSEAIDALREYLITKTLWSPAEGA